LLLLHLLSTTALEQRGERGNSLGASLQAELAHVAGEGIRELLPLEYDRKELSAAPIHERRLSQQKVINAFEQEVRPRRQLDDRPLLALIVSSRPRSATIASLHSRRAWPVSPSESSQDSREAFVTACNAPFKA
jgi:hypothetical protein